MASLKSVNLNEFLTAGKDRACDSRDGCSGGIGLGRRDGIDPILRTDRERCLGLRIERASDHLLWEPTNDFSTGFSNGDW